MKIPDHLVDLVRELAEAHFERVSGDLRLIQSYVSSAHKTAEAQRGLLARARELCAHLGCKTKVAA